MRDGSYKIMVVCENGHVLTSSADYGQAEIEREPYCKICGSKNIYTCPSCSALIQGNYYIPGIVLFTETERPNYCQKCSTPYPWTQASFDAAAELFELDSLISNEDKRELLKILPDLMAKEPTPRSEVAVVKASHILPKLGNATFEAFKAIMFEVASSAITGKLFPG